LKVLAGTPGKRKLNGREPKYSPKSDTFVVSPEQARFLLVTEPAGFEGFVRGLAAPAAAAEIPPAPTAPPDMEPVLRAAAEYGLEILGPPGIPG